LQTLQDYIFQALEHFPTKFCNFTNFIMFFLAVVFDNLSSSSDSLHIKNCYYLVLVQYTI
jgi:hypothetical protein